MGRGPLSRRRPRRRGPLHRAHQPAARRVPSRHSRRRRHLGRSPGFCRPEHKVTLIAVCTRPMSRADRSRFGGGVRSMRDDFSRRVFLKTSSMAGAAVAFAEEARGTARAALTPAPAPSWVHRPMRWAQLTLVEDDPGKFDSRFWLDYFRRTQSDAVCLSAGGCVAYYPTEVPLHHRSRWLGSRDVFGELVKGCRDLGISGTPLLDGLDDAPRIIHGTSRLEVTPRRAFPNPPLTLIPSYPDLPMEMVYPRVLRTEIPEVYVSEVGASRVVYFPWDIDRVFWEVLAVDHGLLLRNAVRWATNEVPPAEVKGPGVLDVSVWRQQRSMTVHLVNLTNPMMMKGPFRELIPVSEQQVVVRLPAGARARRVQLLRDGRVLPVPLDAARLSLKVPSIRDHEIVAIDLES